MGIIYQAYNMANGKLYIGQTKQTLRKRANQHCSDAKASRAVMVFHAAIRKYGCSNFEWRILIEVDDSLLDAAEIYYIDLALDQGFILYNSTDGGSGRSGYTYTDEAKAKISIARKGIVFSEEHKANISAAHKGKDHANAIRRMQEVNTKVYYLRSPEGQIVEIYNMARFCKLYGLNNGHMSDVVNGKRKSAHGWTRIEQKEDT